MTFVPPTTPADPDLYNEACVAGVEYREGRLSEEAYLAVMALYQRAEREQLERAWEAAS